MNGTSIYLPAIATLEACTRLAHELPGLLAEGGVLRIDASGVRKFDSTVISLLLHARRLAQSIGGTVELTGLPPALLGLAQLYGVESLLAPASRPSCATDCRDNIVGGGSR